MAKERPDIEKEQDALVHLFQLQDSEGTDSSVAIALDDYTRLVCKNRATLSSGLGRHRQHELGFRPAIRGDAVAAPDQLESYARYEVHLDRKLERTLSTLLKLQQWRRENV
jgi:hypothetical protein